MPRPTEEGAAAALTHPDTGHRVFLDPTAEYDAKDPMVKRYPWAFTGVPKVTKRTRTEKA